MLRDKKRALSYLKGLKAHTRNNSEGRWRSGKQLSEEKELSSAGGSGIPSRAAKSQQSRSGSLRLIRNDFPMPVGKSATVTAPFFRRIQ